MVIYKNFCTSCSGLYEYNRLSKTGRQKILRLLFIFQTLIAAISWLAWFIAAQDSTLGYFVQKSFFLPVPLEQVKNQVVNNFSLAEFPSWLICLNDLHIPSGYQVLNHLSMLVFVIIYGFIFFKTLFPDFNFPQFKPFTEKQIQPKNDPSWLIAIAFISTLMLPANSSDIFGYISFGEEIVQYHQNPYSEILANIENWRLDPLLGNKRWEYNPSPYGPVFTLICKFFVSISWNNLWLSFFIFKIFNFICYLLLIYIFHYTLKYFPTAGTSDSSKVWYLVALNPLLIIQGLWNGHNDLLLAVLAFASVFFTVKALSSEENAEIIDGKQSRVLLKFLKPKYLGFNLAICLLILSVLIKYITIILIPLLLLWIWKRERYIPYYGLITGILCFYFSSQYFNLFNIDYTEISNNATLFHKSLFDVINTVFKLITKKQDHENDENVEIQVCKQSLDLDFLKSLSLVYAVLLLIISPKFHSWYLISLLPFAAISHPRLCFALSLGHLLSITFIDQAHVLNYLLMTVVPVAQTYFYDPRSRSNSKVGV
jgi:hypothetical protein